MVEESQIVKIQKAVDEVETVVWATCEFGSIGREKMNVLVNLFAGFQRDYDKQVHPSRKQLEAIINDIHYGLAALAEQHLKELFSSSEETK